ncbi:hypothetical protein DFJ73DRAFT_655641 [Zopfochytrium polystomum]|nr:hypothetical protein DFJ73DRAFT_655641 [Zopfochytrium polystomum]
METLELKHTTSAAAATITKARNRVESTARVFSKLCVPGMDAAPSWLRRGVDHLLEGICGKRSVARCVGPLYLKTLKELLSIRKHREHLRPTHFSRIYNLCVASISSLEELPAWGRDRIAASAERLEYANIFSLLAMSTSIDASSRRFESMLHIAKYVTNSSNSSADDACTTCLLKALLPVIVDVFPDRPYEAFESLEKLVGPLCALWERLSIRDRRGSGAKGFAALLLRLYTGTTIFLMDHSVHDVDAAKSGAAAIYELGVREHNSRRSNVLVDIELCVPLLSAFLSGEETHRLVSPSRLLESFLDVQTLDADCLCAFVFLDAVSDAAVLLMRLGELRGKAMSGASGRKRLRRETERVNLGSLIRSGGGGVGGEKSMLFALQLAAFVVFKLSSAAAESHIGDFKAAVLEQLSDLAEAVAASVASAGASGTNAQRSVSDWAWLVLALLAKSPFESLGLVWSNLFSRCVADMQASFSPVQCLFLAMCKSARGCTSELNLSANPILRWNTEMLVLTPVTLISLSPFLAEFQEETLPTALSTFFDSPTLYTLDQSALDRCSFIASPRLLARILGHRHAGKGSTVSVFRTDKPNDDGQTSAPTPVPRNDVLQAAILLENLQRTLPAILGLDFRDVGAVFKMGGATRIGAAAAGVYSTIPSLLDGMLSSAVTRFDNTSSSNGLGCVYFFALYVSLVVDFRSSVTPFAIIDDSISSDSQQSFPHSFSAMIPAVASALSSLRSDDKNLAISLAILGDMFEDIETDSISALSASELSGLLSLVPIIQALRDVTPFPLAPTAAYTDQQVSGDMAREGPSQDPFDDEDGEFAIKESLATETSPTVDPGASAFGATGESRVDVEGEWSCLALPIRCRDGISGLAFRTLCEIYRLTWPSSQCPPPDGKSAEVDGASDAMHVDRPKLDFTDLLNHPALNDESLGLHICVARAVEGSLGGVSHVEMERILSFYLDLLEGSYVHERSKTVTAAFLKMFSKSLANLRSMLQSDDLVGRVVPTFGFFCRLLVTKKLGVDLAVHVSHCICSYLSSDPTEDLLFQSSSSSFYQSPENSVFLPIESLKSLLNYPPFYVAAALSRRLPNLFRNPSIRDACIHSLSTSITARRAARKMLTPTDVMLLGSANMGARGGNFFVIETLALADSRPALETLASTLSFDDVDACLGTVLPRLVALKSVDELAAAAANAESAPAGAVAEAPARWPIEAAGFESFRHLLLDSAGMLVGNYLCGMEMVDLLSLTSLESIIGTPISELISNDFASTMAIVFSAGSNYEDVLKHVKLTIGTEVYSKLLKKKCSGIVYRLLVMVDVVDSWNMPGDENRNVSTRCQQIFERETIAAFSKPDGISVSRALTALSRLQAEMNENTLSSILGKDRLLTIYLRLAADVESRRVSPQSFATSFSLLLGLCLEPTENPLIFFYALQGCIKAISTCTADDEEILYPQRAFSILIKFAQPLLPDFVLGDVLSKHLLVVSSLQSGASTFSSPHARFLKQVEDELTDALSRVAGFEILGALLTQSGKDIPGMTLAAGTVPPSNLEKALDKLLDLWTDNKSTRLARVIAALWQKRDMATNSTRLTSFLESLLADPALVPEDLVRDVVRCSAVSYTAPKETSAVAAVLDRHVAALGVIKFCLEDQSTAVRSEACRIARLVVASKTGLAALKSCSGEVAAFLQIFQGRGNAIVDPALPSRTGQPDEFNLRCGPQDYLQWVSSTVQSMLVTFETDFIFASLENIVLLSPKAAERLFKFVLCAILELEGDGDRRAIMHRSLRGFFREFETENLSSLRLVIDSLIYLRIALKEEGECIVAEIAKSNVQSLCRAALRLKEARTALMFLELSLTHSDETPGDAEYRIMLELFEALDDDSHEGALSKIELDESNLLRRFRSQKRWVQSLLFSESRLVSASLGRGTSATQLKHYDGDFLSSSAQLGLFHTVLGAQSKHLLDADLAEEYQQSLWRCGTWSQEDLPPSAQKPQLHSLLNLVLRKFSSDSPEECKASVEACWKFVSRNFLSTRTRDWLLRPTNHLLVEAESCLGLLNPASAQEAASKMSDWTRRCAEAIELHGFDAVETIVVFRSHLLLSLRQRHSLKSGSRQDLSAAVQSTLCEILLIYCKHARKAALYCNAQTGLSTLRNIVSGPAEGVALEIELEAAKLLWSQQDEGLAVKMLSQLLNRSDRNSTAKTAILTHKLAKWSHARRLDTPRTIFDLFNSATKLLHRPADGFVDLPDLRPGQIEACFYSFAKFADDSYEALLGDETNLALAAVVKDRKKEMEELAAQSKGETSSALRKLKAQIRLDQQDLASHADRVSSLLQKCLQCYLLCLEAGAKRDVAVFRLVSLWFANSDKGAVNDLVGLHLSRISSHKFVELVYQLSARMTTETSKFQAVLQELILRLALEHPFHSLYQIVALKNGTAETVAAASVNFAAAALLQKIKASAPADGALRPKILALDALCDAYLEFAGLQVPSSSLARGKGGSGKHKLDRRMRLHEAKDVEVPVVSAALSVSPNGDYAQVETIASFAKDFKLVGGVNLPKVLECYGSHGNTYIQLVKGGSDDLRQDAVLSKIFTVVNMVLRKDAHARKRNLSVRTYKVIPLGKRAGVIEWVQDSMPVGEYLSTSHPKYRPKDLTPSEARKTMMKEHEREGSNPASKLDVYRQIEARLRPVFRHFFFDHFGSAAEWFDARLTYTRSVAVNAIAGWVVGLGDRHTQNVLIDLKNGETIQIDLGIAFDQGRLLSTPELVPFRLTRDVVDGFGSLGVDGAFRRCSQETLRVLRGSADVLFTILDVFRHDPLYQWTKTQPRRQAATAAGQSSGTAAGTTGGGGKKNQDAERALIGVRRKLAASLSVECQVSELVQVASDPANLARMYPGWQSWL